MDQPTARAICSIPKTSRSICACSRTLSYCVTFGKRGPSNGAGVLDGDEDNPLPIMFRHMMKYFSGSSAMPGPIR